MGEVLPPPTDQGNSNMQPNCICHIIYYYNFKNKSSKKREKLQPIKVVVFLGKETMNKQRYLSKQLIDCFCIFAYVCINHIVEIVSMPIVVAPEDV